MFEQCFFPASLTLLESHGVSKFTSTFTCLLPAIFCTAERTSVRITSIAGHPTNVGVMVTSTVSEFTETLVIIPRSTTLMVGISGSETVCMAAYTSSNVRLPFC